MSNKTKTKGNVQDLYQHYIYKSRYARFLWNEGRRENWDETVKRYVDYMRHLTESKAGKKASNAIPWKDLEQAIYEKQVMPSMRALMTAGPALERDHVAGYNCAYLPIDSPRAFDELMYVLLCGTGVGYSVERQYINKLPEVSETFHKSKSTTITVADSKLGWASSLKDLIYALYGGTIPVIDYSRIRPAGAPLRTFGGRASGPEPLQELFEFTINLFSKAAGRKLNSLEVHDLVCKIAQVVVVGGVRRSALLSLSNLTDERMRNAKMGDFFISNPQRALANNSVAYTEKPDMGIFMKEWTNLYMSKSGERGIFNRQAAKNTVPERRDKDWDFGTNPCSEIILRPNQFCNLTEVVVYPSDTQTSILEKIEMATILGTIQSQLTDFRYLSRKWYNNTSEERLLGVSLTGIMDNPIMYTRHQIMLGRLKAYSEAVNVQYANILGIPKSAAITCVKPSGTVSQLCGTSSGIHPRYSSYYIRRVRGDYNDPVGKALLEIGVPGYVSQHNPREYVYEFPIKSPSKSVTSDSISAVDQIKLWKDYARHYCEHKPSCSIYVREHEWLEVAAMVYKDWDIINGLSFFPYDDHVYPEAPYEPISRAEYNKLERQILSKGGTIRERIQYLDNVKENTDTTTSSQELACVGGACEL
ncbi:MAG: ribonucleoside-triphosphate reductase [Chloroflexi bacterium]|nr:MAG: ribonucleoside-triphosphate reductase [Chloroflexota bacterium]